MMMVERHMSRVQSEAISSVAERDYTLVKSYLDKLKAPFYDSETKKALHGTPIHDITKELVEFTDGDLDKRWNHFYLKEEYKNQLTESVKGRAVAAMVLNAIEAGAIYNQFCAKKKWIEPTSGNTGKGLAEIAKVLGVEFTAVFSRLDVSKEIKNSLAKSNARMITIGSEYNVTDLEEQASRYRKSVHYYWTMIAKADENKRSLLISHVNNTRQKAPNSANVVDIREIDAKFLLDTLLPLAVEASEAPIIKRVQQGEFEDLRNKLRNSIPNLDDPNALVVFFCNHGTSSMAVNTLLSQLGFANVCSLKGGVEALKDDKKTNPSNEYCPVPGSSITLSSIEFVKRVVANNPEEYFTFMQYENIENVHAHMTTTGPEIFQQIPDVDVVVCTFGTGGTATGLAKYFKEKGVETHVAFPERPVEGIRTLSAADGLLFYQPELYSRVLEVRKSRSDKLIKHMLRKGINIGPSTAIALQAAIDSSATMKESNFVVIGADGIENYESEYREILFPFTNQVHR